MVQHSAAAFDPFTPPPTVAIQTVQVRDRVAIAGVVTDLAVHYWIGGAPALHVTVTDETGSLTGAFLGRTRIGGVALGETIVLSGAVGLRWGRRLFVNPHLWLCGCGSGRPGTLDRVLSHA